MLQAAEPLVNKIINKVAGFSTALPRISGKGRKSLRLSGGGGAGTKIVLRRAPGQSPLQKRAARGLFLFASVSTRDICGWTASL
jgi:hypothetical protein